MGFGRELYAQSITRRIVCTIHYCVLCTHNTQKVELKLFDFQSESNIYNAAGVATPDTSRIFVWK